MRGVSRSSRTRDGMRWTWQRRARDVVAGQGIHCVNPVSHRTARGRTALQRLHQNSAGGTWPVEAFGGGCCGRQSRVVLAPVAGVKLAEVFRAQPGFDEPYSLCDGDKTNSSPGRARRKPLKPLRGESRVISGATVVTTVCLLPMHTGCGCSGHPAFPAPSVFRGTTFMQTSGAIRAARTRSRVPDAPST